MISGRSAAKPGARDAHGADDDLQADQLQRDIGHGGDDAGDRHRQRQPAIAEAAAHEIGRRDVVVLVADVPEPRKHQEQDRIDHDRVRHREERDGAGAEGERRNGDEGVGGVEVAADQEPGDEGAEAPAAQAPFVQLIEIALAPLRGGKAQPGDEPEQHHENGQSGPVYLLHGMPPQAWLFVADWLALSRGHRATLKALSFGREINDRGQNRADDHPEHLIPIEERYAAQDGSTVL